MSRVRLTTAGESHGPYEVCIIEGIPAGLGISASDIDEDLARRQQGYGRGGRMAIETDRCELVAGIRLGATLGSPIAILVENRDHANWSHVMGAAADQACVEGLDTESAVPRPGHADFAGMAKYGHSSIRPVLERASARETVARVAGGAVCRRLLAELGVTVRAQVVSMGGVTSDVSRTDYADPSSVDWASVETSVVACEDDEATQAMCEAVDVARASGESLGGVFEVWAWGLCPGLGSHVSHHQRLDGVLLGAVGSIPAVKGVELGTAFANSSLRGSRVHDAFVVRENATWKGIGRETNRAAGLEGGMTNGMPVVIRAAMKPIPTMTKPIASVDTRSLEIVSSEYERSDVTAVPAARVVGEAMVAYVLAGAYIDKFGGDSMDELLRAAGEYALELERQGLWHRS